MSAMASPGSHTVRRFSTPGIMASVLLALLPAIAVQIWFAGALWALTVLVTCAQALLLEALALRLRGRNIAVPLQDGSVLVIAILLLLMLPVTAPWWLATAGISVAVVLGKHIFGGLGQNLFNPALVGYLGLLALFPVALFPVALFPVALFPETIASYGHDLLNDNIALPNIALTLALMAGGLYLLLRRIIGWHIPVTILLTTALLFYIFNMTLVSSFAMLAAFFLATDPVTSPGTRRGKLIYGSMIGIVTTIMANYLHYPVAVAAAVVTMNAAVPTLDQLIKHDKPRPKIRERPQ